ncbi:MAG: transporter substrate-binding domain-containing protein [Chloroflexi bacterium]|nr:transporter substrate-binding domain-containing protein [Chloroflexota bacterium]
MTTRSLLALLAAMVLIGGCAQSGGTSPSASAVASVAPSAAESATEAAPSEAMSPSEAAPSEAMSPSELATGGEASPSEAASADPAADPCAFAEGTGSPAPSAASSPAAATNPDDLLATILEEGVMQVSTDPNYAPQSSQCPDGTFVGFDIDVAKELGRRLGVEVEFEVPTFDLVVAGGWNERWDVSVGSVTVTPEREGVLDFTEPYYFTPAQLAATQASGITDIEGFAGKAICVGSSTTYQFWLEGTLDLGPEGGDVTPPPEGATAFPLETDQLCAQAATSGRTDFDGWLTSSTTVQQAIDAGAPFTPIGDPVFYEPLAAATDKNGPPHDELQAELDRIVSEMHEDGTLTALSEKWFGGLDLTKRQ